MDPHYLAEASEQICSMKMEDAQHHADALLTLGSVKEIGAALQAAAISLAPE